MDRIKTLVKRTPVIRDLARAVMARIAGLKSKGFNSAEYWDARYRHGRNSGAGSYNRLAQFKADTVNRFVREKEVRSVIEFGCGDGSQLKLAKYPEYIGVDVSKTVIKATSEMFICDPTKVFVHANDLQPHHCAQLSLSLDVVYHLVELEVFEQYMAQLFDAASRYVIVYSSNDERRSESTHVRHRRFTDWVERKRPDFRQIGFIKNPYPDDIRDPDNTSFADFYFFEREGEASQT